MMKSLLIVGAGEYGQVVKEIAEDNGYSKIDFLDDKSDKAVGKVSDYMKFKEQYCEFIVAIGNSEIRKQIYEELSNVFSSAILVSSKSYVSKSAVIGSGSIIEPMAVIHTGVNIGIAAIVNAGAVINHNSIVGDYCQIDCNAVVSARAIVPNRVKVNSGQVWEKSK